MQLSLTVEETNVLRKQVGLVPIPVEGEQDAKVSEKVAMAQDRDGFYSISLEETNRLRVQVGLQPIGSYSTETVVENRQHSKVDRVRDRIERAHKELKKDEYKSRGGVVERAGDQNEEEWLAKVGTRLKFKGDKAPEVKEKKVKKSKSVAKAADSTVKIDQSVTQVEHKIEAPPQKPVPKPKRKLVVFDSDSESSDNSDSFRARDYAKPKKRRTVAKAARRKREDVVVDESAFKKVDLVDEDAGDDDDEDLGGFISATRTKKIQNRPQIVPQTKSSSVLASEPGIVIDEDALFLDRISRPKPKLKVEKKIEPVESAEVSDERLARVGAILEEASSNSESFGLGSALDLLKEDSKGDTSDGKVQLVYRDDNGKELSTKEAYKYLSHKFHGFNKKK